MTPEDLDIITRLAKVSSCVFIPLKDWMALYTSGVLQSDGEVNHRMLHFYLPEAPHATIGWSLHTKERQAYFRTGEEGLSEPMDFDYLDKFIRVMAFA